MFDLTKQGKRAPGLHYGFDRVLHGEQYTEIRAPWPTHGTLTHKIKVKDIFDKGKGALVIQTIVTSDEAGTELAYNEVSTFVRGAGGWGGDRGPSADVNVAPTRAPDAVVEQKTEPNQALVYRLSGDWNPLHVDPTFAKNFGFERPILHGLSTFGFAARHVISKFAPGGDPRYFKSIKARFAKSVFPGDTLVTEMWKESDTRIVFQTRVKERGDLAISNAAVEFFTEIPKKVASTRVEGTKTEGTKVASAQAVPSTPADRASFGSADAFTAIEDHIARHPELVSKVGKVFVFKLTSPESAWRIDLKNGKGGVQAGAGPADATLELTDADFLAMTSGKADAMKLYMGGKLKIGGDVMASQKLSFLQKIDPAQALEAVIKKRGGGAPAASASPAAPAPAASTGSRVPGLFKALEDRLVKSPGLSKEVRALVQFDVKGAGGALERWIVDMTGAGAVREGAEPKARTTLRLDEADLFSLCEDPTRSRDLYQHGKLRVDGDVRVAHKLGFLKDLI
jgi:(3R)-3-hydroxyacyl-CoA dehydrogenase / 3a,7a,12a-trihydroxy-5b-cholest-24-enoyl-CoA hydratase / enoyl-CoA hydratase 2